MTVTIGKTDLEVQLEICKRAVDAWRRYEESKGQHPLRRYSDFDWKPSSYFLRRIIFLGARLVFPLTC